MWFLCKFVRRLNEIKNWFWLWNNKQQNNNNNQIIDEGTIETIDETNYAIVNFKLKVKTEKLFVILFV